MTALGIALSPFAVIPAILLLFTRRRVATSVSFAAGWIAGVLTVTAVAVALTDVITLPDHPPGWASWTRIVLGVALVATGLVTLLRRSPEAAAPGWLTSLEQATPAQAARFGLLGSAANPKVALLALAGGFSIGAALDGMAKEVAAVTGFAAVAGSTSVLPVLAYVLLGEGVLDELGRLKDWLTARADTVVSVVLLVLGAGLAYKGLSVVLSHP